MGMKSAISVIFVARRKNSCGIRSLTGESCWPKSNVAFKKPRGTPARNRSTSFLNAVDRSTRLRRFDNLGRKWTSVKRASDICASDSVRTKPPAEARGVCLRVTIERSLVSRLRLANFVRAATRKPPVKGREVCLRVRFGRSLNSHLPPGNSARALADRRAQEEDSLARPAESHRARTASRSRYPRGEPRIVA